MFIGGIGYTEILQRKCGKERIYVETKNTITDNSTSRRGGKVRIIVERVYNGTRDMEEIFRPVNEMNTMHNIREMMQNAVSPDSTESA